MSRFAIALVFAMLLSFGQVAVEAGVVIETITVGNPGNDDDTEGDGYGGVGFRVAEVPERECDFDYDDDCNVDLSDFAAFQRCFGSQPDALCRGSFDCNNADGQIALDDYAAFYAAFTSQNAPPCGMALIPGGEFEMGRHQIMGGRPQELPIHPVYVSSFYMDIYEVTNVQYCEYLNSAYSQGLIEVTDGVVYKVGDGEPYCHTYSAAGYSRIHWDGITFTITTGREDHPMVAVSWFGAVAYANWRSVQHRRQPCYDLSTWECNFEANGYRLPTEAEWEYAARGGEHDPYYPYPWGVAVEASMANCRETGDPYEFEGFPQTTPVGYYDGGQVPPGVDMANGYGLYDVAGNVWEWCNDWYDPEYYSSSPYDNPRGPAGGAYRILRGGSWYGGWAALRCACRGGDGPNSCIYRNGFRIVAGG